ncbi:MAG: ParB/RepB/Spo0J family partition protein [Lachnospiraceae bacterium]|nr:ParB/RepB/Spo0J family partition protein [Lachnospiraceae bacterium]
MAESSFIQFIQDDIKKYEGNRGFVKASLLERILVKKQPPDRLHPNPEDEFSIRGIGPNMSIVNNYEKTIRTCLRFQEPIFAEPIYVEKMLPEGYMILNGHHRWAAAVRMNIKTVRVKVVNVTHEEEIYRMLKASDGRKRVILDLDDVVFAAEGEAYEPLFFPYSEVYQCRMKLGMAAFLAGLKEMGYDIWAFTESIHSAKYFDEFFRAHNLQLTGIVNCMDGKRVARMKKNKKLEKAFSYQYKQSLTLLKDSAVFIDAETKSYEMLDMDFSGATGNLLEQIAAIEDRYAAVKKEQEDQYDSEY